MHVLAGTAAVVVLRKGGRVRTKAVPAAVAKSVDGRVVGAVVEDCRGFEKF